MDRRHLITAGIALAGASALDKAARAQDGQGGSYGQGGQYPQAGQYQQDTQSMPPPAHGPAYQADTYSQDELVNRVSDFCGVTAETAGSVITRIFSDYGRPTGYIAGTEGSGAFFFGLRYGKGLLYMKNRETQTVYWQGPTASPIDWGGNAARVFTLCYNLQYPDMIYRRFPGVEGSAYFVGGIGFNYQRADEITLAPIRAGVGLRLGANIGYLAYSRQRNIIPL